MDTLRLILIGGIIVGAVVLMMMKKIPTIMALPIMGFLVAFVAAVGTQPNFGLLDYTSVVNGKTITNPGIFNYVITDGVKMMAGAIVTVIFASSFSKILMKQGIIEKIIKTAAEYAGDRPMVLAFLFYIVVSVVFMALGGLGGIILVGSIVLPIMLSAGIKPLHAACIFLFSFSSGGVLNPMNFSAYIPLLEQTKGSSQAAQEMLISMSWPIYIVAFCVPLFYVITKVRPVKPVKSWLSDDNLLDEERSIHKITMIAPVVPVILLITSQLLAISIPAEIAIVIGILFVMVTTHSQSKTQLITQSFVEGTQDVSGVILLLVGLGILIKGVQYPAVQVIIGPIIELLVGYLKNPITYVIGFGVASIFALYRGPLNTYGIGGALPTLFGAAGLSPMATIWALRATGNMQGFGDPTNSHNIWIAEFVNVDVSDILKEVLGYGIVMTVIILFYGVFIAKIPLTV